MKKKLYEFLNNDEQLGCVMQFFWEDCKFITTFENGSNLPMSFNKANETRIEFKKIVLLNDTLKIVIRPEVTFQLTLMLKLSILKEKLSNPSIDIVVLSDEYFNVMDNDNVYDIRMEICNESISLYYSEKSKDLYFDFRTLEKTEYV